MHILKLKRSLPLAILLAAAPVSLAFAQTAAETSADGSLVLMAQQQSYLDVMANLEAAGYVVDSTKTTFLGRVQITAHNLQHRRQVVVSRATGEIKSDIITEYFEGSTDTALDAAVSDAAAAETGTAGGGLLRFFGFGGKTPAGSSGTSAGTAAGATASGSAGTTASTSAGSVTGNVSSSVSGTVGGGLSGGTGVSAGASGSVSGGLGIGN